jgi:hypothetical protein
MVCVNLKYDSLFVARAVEPLNKEINGKNTIFYRCLTIKDPLGIP